MSDGLIIILVCAVAISVMFKTTWKLAYVLFWWSLYAAKWVIIVGLVVGCTCCQQFYDMAGWTPISLAFGDSYYHQHKVGHVQKRY